MFTVKGSPDRSMPLAAIAFEAFTAHNLPDGLEPNLEAQVTYDPPNFSWPFGTHICVVEVDTRSRLPAVFQLAEEPLDTESDALPVGSVR